MSLTGRSHLAPIANRVLLIRRTAILGHFRAITCVHSLPAGRQAFRF